MKAVLQFENHQSVADRFRQRHLEPKLREVNAFDSTAILFQDYLDRRAAGAPVLSPSEVAAQAVRKWERLDPTPEKTVWILDLDPTGSSTPDSSYGLCVLSALASELGLPIEHLLSHSSFLVGILTLYPADLREDDGIPRLQEPICDLSVLARLWRRVNRIQNENPARVTAEEVERADLAARRDEPRIILGNAGNDDIWLSSLIIRWLVS